MKIPILFEFKINIINQTLNKHCHYFINFKFNVNKDKYNIMLKIMFKKKIVQRIYDVIIINGQKV